MRRCLAVLILLVSTSAQALEWSDLWLNDYQKAQKLLIEQPALAAEKFRDPEWQGVAKYNAGDYQEAARRFSDSDDITSAYNLGNALARGAELEKALQAYESLLEKPDLPEKLKADATFNRDLVKKLLEQQQQQSGENADSSESPGEEQSQEQQEQQSQSEQQTGQSSAGEQQESQDQQAQENSQSDQEAGQSREQQGRPEPDQEPSDKEQQAGTSADRQQQNEKDHRAEQTAKQALANQEQSMTEDQQATEQWLRQIPDDPSGLLRRKLIQSHRTQYPQVQNGGQAW